MHHNIIKGPPIRLFLKEFDSEYTGFEYRGSDLLCTAEETRTKARNRFMYVMGSKWNMAFSSIQVWTCGERLFHRIVGWLHGTPATWYLPSILRKIRTVSAHVGQCSAVEDIWLVWSCILSFCLGLMLAIAITILLVHILLRSKNLVHNALKGLGSDISRGVVGVGVCENLPGSQRSNLGKGCLPRRGRVRF
jgi:hypothetical protein